MALTVCVLGSGSRGNSIYVGAGRFGLLVDAGLSARETESRLEQAGLSIRQVCAIVLSHEHSDHTTGVRALHRKYGLPLYANSGTVEALQAVPELAELPWNVFSTGYPFQVGDFRIEPFAVSHDAMDPVGFVIHAEGARLGIATDIGTVTALVRERLRRCRVLIVEANHDEQLLLDADRPWSLKQRIASRQGHLSNRDAAELIADLAGPELEWVFLAHLSEECNSPNLALEAVRNALARCGRPGIPVALSYAHRISEVWRG